MSAVKYELGLYIPEDGILLSDCRENLKSQDSLPLPGNRTATPQLLYQLCSPEAQCRMLSLHVTAWHTVTQLAVALCCKPEGRGFESTLGN
jgi:hypothetical protein